MLTFSGDLNPSKTSHISDVVGVVNCECGHVYSFYFQNGGTIAVLSDLKAIEFESVPERVVKSILSVARKRKFVSPEVSLTNLHAMITKPFAAGELHV